MAAFETTRCLMGNRELGAEMEMKPGTTTLVDVVLVRGYPTWFIGDSGPEWGSPIHQLARWTLGETMMNQEYVYAIF